MIDLSSLKLSLGATSPLRAHQLATIYGLPRLPTEDGLGQGWAYLYSDRDMLDVDRAEQLRIATLLLAAPKLYGLAKEAQNLLLTFSGGQEDDASRTALRFAQAIAEAEGRQL
ncbi:hypothetical protein JP74_09065 [Devosia sp. 17-2-E-8]|nr:hypothetical protein JP74_09065 [Devosia sp. 17-2-E-8]